MISGTFPDDLYSYSCLVILNVVLNMLFDHQVAPSYPGIRAVSLIQDDEQQPALSDVSSTVPAICFP